MVGFSKETTSSTMRFRARAQSTPWSQTTWIADSLSATMGILNGVRSQESQRKAASTRGGGGSFRCKSTKGSEGSNQSTVTNWFPTLK